MAAGRSVSAASLGALAAGVVLMLALHVMPPTNEINPMRRTISQYALGPNKWIFDVAVLLVALGSALAFAELVRRRLVRPLSAPVVLGSLWIAQPARRRLVHQDRLDGRAERGRRDPPVRERRRVRLAAARGAARGAAGVRGLARAGGSPRRRSPAWRSASWACCSSACCGWPPGGGPWWLFLPLGLVERTMALSAVAAIAVVVLGLARAKSRDAVRVAA